MVRGLRWEQSRDAASLAKATRLEASLDKGNVGRSSMPGRPRKRPERLGRTGFSLLRQHDLQAA